MGQMYQGFNRKEVEERKAMKKAYRDMGVPMDDPEPMPLPAPTSRASRPDLFPAFHSGKCGATRKHPWRDQRTAGGHEVQDVNTRPTDKVATSGADRPSGAEDTDRHGRSIRPRKISR